MIMSVLLGSILLSTILLCYLNCKANKLSPSNKHHGKGSGSGKTYVSEKKYSI